MEARRLGRQGSALSVIGFGAWAIGGGGYAWGWGEQDDAVSIAAIRRALELGVNWIDTAPSYGLGRSEEIVGRAGQGQPGTHPHQPAAGVHPPRGGSIAPAAAGGRD